MIRVRDRERIRQQNQPLKNEVVGPEAAAYVSEINYLMPRTCEKAGIVFIS